jgi:hypothetical protein
VGSFIDPSSGKEQTLTEHWDGSNWTVIPSPNPGSTFDRLTAVRAASPTSIWAVGESVGAEGTPGQSLILHWDGARWVQQDAPSPGTNSSELTAVRSVSATEAWAVGSSSDGLDIDKTLILHFTGGQWQQVDPPASAVSGILHGIAGTSSKDVWAVGNSTGTGSRTIILHWNGTGWSRVPSPNPGVSAQLSAVGVTSPSNALIVGNELTTTNQSVTLALHWDGKTWTQVPTLNPGGTRATDALMGVTLTSQTNAWAVGSATVAGVTRPLIERWSGTTWSAVVPPDPGVDSALFAVASSSATNAWAVGTMTEPGPDNQVLALHCC